MTTATKKKPRTYRAMTVVLKRQTEYGPPTAWLRNTLLGTLEATPFSNMSGTYRIVRGRRKGWTAVSLVLSITGNWYELDGQPKFCAEAVVYVFNLPYRYKRFTFSYKKETRV